MPLTASKLRQDVYRILDGVLATGVPVEIERKGRILRIVPSDTPSKFDCLVDHDAMSAPPEDYVSIDWSEEWRP
jgi:hypothetical protein